MCLCEKINEWIKQNETKQIYEAITRLEITEWRERVLWFAECVYLAIYVGRERVLLAETKTRNQVETVFPKIRTKGEEVFKEFDRKLV